MRVWVIILIGLVLFHIQSEREVYAQSELPNILWIYVEDMSPWLGCYGDSINDIETPNIDLMAKEGVLFERAFAPAPVCSATRSAVIVGQSAIRFGAHQHRSSRAGTPIYLPKNYKLLPELLKDVGYTTFNHGKDDYNFIWDKSVYSFELESPTNFLSLIDKQPFFGQIQTKGGKGNLWKFPKNRRVNPNEVDVPADYPNDDAFREIVAQHYDAIRLEDDGVGKIFNGLKNAGILDNTIVVFFSDHGANHLVRHKQMVTEGGLHVPLIIRGPEHLVPINRRRTDLVSLLDLTATTLSWADIEIPSWYEGQDLFSSKYAKRNFLGAHKDRLDHTIDRVRSIRSERYRYVKNYHVDRIFLQPQYRDKRPAIQHLKKLFNLNQLTDLHRNIYFGERPDEELYDIIDDPAMTQNLINNPKYKNEVDNHRKLLNQWLSYGDMGSNKESIQTLKANGEGQIWGEGVNVEYERYRKDSDGDGLSDKWEMLNNRDPNDGKVLFQFDCGGWQTEGWFSHDIESNLSGLLGTIDFDLSGNTGSIERHGLSTKRYVDLDKLLLLGRVDHDVNVDLFINNRKVGTGFISASKTNKSITIPIKNNTPSNLITDIKIVFSGKKKTRLVFDSMELIDRKKDNLPNVIYILADDLGYGEVGFNGQKKIKTPELDFLAKEGMRFTAHYSGSAVCAPARCSLMTGLHSGHGYIRSNSPGYPNGQMPIPENTETVAKLMKRAGYNTAIIGKWGLGGVVDDTPNPTLNSGHPNKQGFDHFFGYLDQRKAHNYYPTHLWRNNEYVSLANKTNGWDKSNQDYSHDLMTEEAISWITSNQEEPMFLYLAYCIPHVWWQVPDLGMYKDMDWPQNHFNIQAAMVSRLDRDIGRIRRCLEELDIADNTLIIFNSDNGAHGRGGTLEFFEASGDLRGKKRMMTEGGLRSPMVAYWPKTIPKGVVSDHPSAFWDFLPTMSDLTGTSIVGETDGISMLPTFVGNFEKQLKHDYLYWELYEGVPSCAVVMQDWKGIIKDRRKPNNFELYNLKTDPSEKNNLSKKFPVVVDKIKEIMSDSHVPNKYWKKFNKPLFNSDLAYEDTKVLAK